MNLPVHNSNRRSRFILVSFFSLLGGAIATPFLGLYLWSSQQAFVQPPPAVAETPQLEDKTPTKSKIVALGRIEPTSSVIKVGGPINERVGELLVTEGEWVNKGQIIGYLQSYEERSVALQKAKEDLAIAESRLVAEAKLSQAQLQERQIDALQAPQAVESELSAQRAHIRELEIQKRLADTELKRYQNLVGQGAAPARELEQREVQVEQLEQQIRQAKDTLAKLKKSSERELANIQAQVQTAKVNQSRILANSEITSLEKAIRLAEVQRDNSIIKSPSAGRILRIITRTGEAIGDNGRGQGILVTLADTRRMQVVAEVNEADIQQVRTGQVASIISRNKAFDRTLTGQVQEIGQQIFKNNVLNDDPSAFSDARVIEVKIQIDDSRSVAALTNLQVEVQIPLSSDSEQQASANQHS